MEGNQRNEKGPDGDTYGDYSYAARNAGHAMCRARKRMNTIMTLREKQSKFVAMVALLIQFAYEQGYELTFGDAWATGGHRPNSLHYQRLAIDLNLFREGKYLPATEDHQPLGEFWESIGGSWGGRFQDGNHYSIEHEGRK